MPSPASLYDGCEALAGVSGNRSDLVPSNLAASAVNRRFRFGENVPRLPFRQITMTYPDDKDGNLKRLFDGGNFQGAFLYQSWPTFLNSCIIASFAGTIMRIAISGQTGTVTKLAEGNEPTFRHTWMAQGFEYLFIQNGLQNCIIWDGVNTAFRSDPTGLGQIPVGSVMAFNQGYMVVVGADGLNQIAVSNQVFSTPGITNRSDLTLFNYDGPGRNPFGNSIFLGDVTGLFSMPYLDTGTGQNELIVAAQEGMAAMDLSRDRATWLDSSILRTVVIGEGNLSPYALTGLNGDMFFRAGNGINTYRNTRQEFQTQWNQAPISLDVRRWNQTDRQDLLQFNSQVGWNNYLFSTVSPMTCPANNSLAGWHRYHRGFVVLDCEPESTASRQGTAQWYGMWEGIRPTQFIEGRIGNDHRCFAFSYDQDGFNRLYEIERQGINDVFEGKNRKIFSFIDTGNLGLIPSQTTNFAPKTVQGGQIELSDIAESVTTTVAIKPEATACFVDLATQNSGCDCPTADCFPFSQPQWSRNFFGGFDGKCVPGTLNLLKSVRHWQGRIKMTGWAQIQRMVFRFKPDDDPQQTADCNGNTSCAPVDCCPDAEAYQYQLAPVGVNPNVPFIPTPSDVEPVWNSTQQFTAQCPPGSTGNPVTESASASSNVSQEDADSKALQTAIRQATTQLRCSTCTPSTLVIVDVASMGTHDFSIYFAAGYITGAAGRAFRLIDAETMLLYASGLVDTTGTLVPTYARVTPGEGTFDIATSIYSNDSAVTIPVALEISCPTLSGDTWPSNPPYPY